MVLGFIVRYDIRIKGPRPSLCRRTLPMRKQIAKFYRWVRWISALHMCLSDSQPKERRKSKKAWPLWNRGEDQLLAKSQTSVVGRLFFFFCSRSTKWSHSITRSTEKKIRHIPNPHTYKKIQFSYKHFSTLDGTTLFHHLHHLITPCMTLFLSCFSLPHIPPADLSIINRLRDVIHWFFLAYHHLYRRRRLESALIIHVLSTSHNPCVVDVACRFAYYPFDTKWPPAATQDSSAPNNNSMSTSTSIFCLLTGVVHPYYFVTYITYFLKYLSSIPEGKFYCSHLSCFWRKKKKTKKVVRVSFCGRWMSGLQVT